MRAMLLASTAMLATAFNSDVCETVLVRNSNGEYRMNKSDYDAMEEADRPQLAAAAKREENTVADNSRSIGSDISLSPGEQPPAPSAPAFVNGGNPETPTIASPNQLGVVKNGKVWLVVDLSKQVEGQPPVAYEPKEGEAIDPAGYKTEAEAWKAIMDRPR